MKNHSKKALALFLALSLSLGLTACGSAKPSVTKRPVVRSHSRTTSESVPPGLSETRQRV